MNWAVKLIEKKADLVGFAYQYDFRKRNDNVIGLDDLFVAVLEKNKEVQKKGRQMRDLLKAMAEKTTGSLSEEYLDAQISKWLEYEYSEMAKELVSACTPRGTSDKEVKK